VLKHDQVGIAEYGLLGGSIKKEIGIKFMQIAKIDIWQIPYRLAQGTIDYRMLNIEVRKIDYDASVTIHLFPPKTPVL
jgi:hypothetical protein